MSTSERSKFAGDCSVISRVRHLLLKPTVAITPMSFSPAGSDVPPVAEIEKLAGSSGFFCTSPLLTLMNCLAICPESMLPELRVSPLAKNALRPDGTLRTPLS